VHTVYTVFFCTRVHAHAHRLVFSSCAPLVPKISHAVLLLAALSCLSLCKDTHCRPQDALHGAGASGSVLSVPPSSRICIARSDEVRRGVVSGRSAYFHVSRQICILHAKDSFEAVCLLPGSIFARDLSARGIQRYPGPGVSINLLQGPLRMLVKNENN
jgi:hypothetical protein